MEYSYDEWNRLATAKAGGYPEHTVRVYNYDPFGNLRGISGYGAASFYMLDYDWWSYAKFLLAHRHRVGKDGTTYITQMLVIIICEPGPIFLGHEDFMNNLKKSLIITIVTLLFYNITTIMFGALLGKPIAGGIGVFFGFLTSSHIIGLNFKVGAKIYFSAVVIILFMSLTISIFIYFVE
jgi:hypothetical protein